MNDKARVNEKVAKLLAMAHDNRGNKNEARGR
jgi:hypothetical protein